MYIRKYLSQYFSSLTVSLSPGQPASLVPPISDLTSSASGSSWPPSLHQQRTQTYCSVTCFYCLIAYLGISSLSFHKELSSSLSSYVAFVMKWTFGCFQLLTSQTGVGEVWHLGNRSAGFHSWSGIAGQRVGALAVLLFGWISEYIFF